MKQVMLICIVLTCSVTHAELPQFDKGPRPKNFNELGNTTPVVACVSCTKNLQHLLMCSEQMMSSTLNGLVAHYT